MPLSSFPFHSQRVWLVNSRFPQFTFQTGDKFDLAMLPTAKAGWGHSLTDCH